MSLNRHTMLILMLAGSVGLPYISSTQLGQPASKAMDAGSSADGGTQNPAAGSGYSHPAAGSGSNHSTTSNSSAGYSASGYSGSTTYPNSTSYDSPAAKSAPTPAQAVSTTASAVGGYASSGSSNSNRMDSAGQSASALSATDSAPAHGAGKKIDPPTALADVLRFDITVPWIIEHWPRVSAGLSQLDLHGYRVPLITGTGESDLAGSLTYYFDKKQHLERIIFHGTSGDPRPLVTYVTGHFELKRVIVSDPGLAFYQKTSWGKSHSELLIRPARVLRADIPNKRYEIEMAIKRP